MITRLLCAAALTLFSASAFAAECPVIPPPAPEHDRLGVHGLALHGEPAMATGFTSLPYLNPAAPKGGTIRVSGFGSFDNLNPFIIKGEAADNLGALFDTLMYQSDDEPFTQYGLLAQSVDMPADRSWVSYTLRPEAKFADGTPVLASDVVFTFNTLKEKGNPFYRTYYAEVVKAESEGAHKVKFTFKEAGNRELPLIMGQLPVLSEQDWKGKDFGATTLKAPLGSGAYKLASLEQGRTLVYQLRPDYWGKDLAINKGRFNIERIIIDYYRDENVMMEAFKAGNIDFRNERVARLWATGYDFPAVKDGRVRKEEIGHQNPQGMQGFIFNTRRAVFKDVRVRHALALLMDFEWMNANLFHGQYKRSASFFSNSELASSGLPTCGEKALLESLGDKLPKGLLDTPFTLPVTRGDGNIRDQLKAASDMLKDAGYSVQKGIMTGADGKALTFEVLLYDSAMERVVQPYLRNLERLGIKAKIRMVDTAQYQSRLIDRDYDLIVGGFAQSSSPGNEQLGYWGSASADVTGSPNSAGVKDPVVDALIDKIIKAPSREALVDATRALDRVLLHGWYVVPQWHTTNYRVAYWNRFSHPAQTAKYGLGWPESWWIDPAKDAALKK